MIVCMVVMSTVRMMMIVMIVDVLDAILGRRLDSHQQIQLSIAMTDVSGFNRSRHTRSDGGTHLLALAVGQQVILADNHQIGSTQLIVEQFAQAGIVIEAVIGLALRLDLFDIVGVTPGGDCRSIDDRNHRINRAILLDLGPVEGLYQRLWQRQAGSLDENVIDIVTALDQLLHHRQELFLDRATDTTIGQFIDTILAVTVELISSFSPIFTVQRTAA